MGVLEFIKEQKAKFMAVGTFINRNTKKKGYRGVATKEKLNINTEDKWTWENNLSFEECLEFYESKKREELFPKLQINQYLIYLTPHYLVIDTDDEPAFQIVKSFLKKENIYNKKAITESFNGRTKDIHYKKHFWFKISSISDFENYRGIHQGIGVDIFHYDKCKIAEFTDAKLKSSNIPELSLHHFKTLFIELETLGPIKHLAVKEEPKKVEKEKY